MKKLLFLFVTVLFYHCHVFAQQLPLFSQYFHNPFIYNPAWAGLDKFGSLNFSYRSQWEGIQGGPETAQFTLDLPFYENKCGLGINAYHDKLGRFTQNKIQFSYAYHIFKNYENASVLSFGLTGGLSSNRIDFNNAFILHPGDPLIVNNSGDYQGMELGFGLNYIYKDQYQVAVSLPQLLSSGMRTIDNGANNIKPLTHYMLSFKCTLKTADEVHRIEPMIMLRKAPRSPLQLDVGVQYTFNNMLWANAAFRADYAATAAIGFNVRRFRMGYARDFAIGSLRGIAGSSNEIMLGYKFRHLPTYTYDGKRGNANSNIKRKIQHPSRPGPVLTQPKNNLKGTSKKRPNTYKKRKR